MALFVIDMIGNETIYHGPAWDPLCKIITELKYGVKKFGVPVVHFAYPCKHNTIQLNNGKTKDRELLRYFHPGIAIEADDYLARKKTNSALTPPVVTFLRNRGVDTIILAGIWENDSVFDDDPRSCVTASAKAAIGTGFQIVVAEEATNFAHGIHRDTGMPLHNGYMPEPAERQRRLERVGAKLMPVSDIINLAHEALIASQAPRRPIIAESRKWTGKIPDRGSANIVAASRIKNTL